MALKLATTKTLKTFGVVDNAKVELDDTSVADTFYVKVENVRGNKQTVRFLVSMIGERLNMNQEFVFAPDMDGPNFIKQAYQFLKTLPEFSGAVDC